MLTVFLFVINYSTAVQFFKVNILYEAPNGELSMAPASHVKEQLEAVLRDAKEPAPYPVGILTSEHRDTWAEMRERLARGKGRDTRVLMGLCVHLIQLHVSLLLG